MAESKLGKLATGETHRDAMHVAVIPAKVGQLMAPGTPVSIIDGEAFATSGEAIGIIDPFLRSPVRKGDEVWVLMYPNSVTNLRHEWDHPSVAASTQSDDDYEDECRMC